MESGDSALKIACQECLSSQSSDKPDSDTDTADEGEFQDAVEEIIEENDRAEHSEMDSDFEKLKNNIENGLLLENERAESNTSEGNYDVPEWVYQQCRPNQGEGASQTNDNPNITLADRLNAEGAGCEMPNEETDSEDETPKDKEPEELKEDEDVIIQREASLSKEELDSRQQEAQEFKAAGNVQFKEGDYPEAVSSYSNALRVCPRAFPKDRSIMYSNRAAARMHMDENKLAISDSTAALELNPHYLKALIRRAELYEKTDQLDEALADYQKALEMDPSLHHARQACIRLPDQIKERNEKMKEEMLGKLKELGNMCLKPFGLSTNNFALNQDPNTGSYSISFKNSNTPQQPPPSNPTNHPS